MAKSKPIGKKYKLNFLHICEYASFTEGKKLNILGIFETIHTKELPYIHPQLYVVVNTSTSQDGKFTESIVIRNVTTKEELFRQDFPINVVFGKDKTNANVGLLGQFNNLKLDSFGEYAIEILVNDEILETKSIHVIKAL